MRLIPRALPWAEEQVGLSARIQQSSKPRCPLLKTTLPIALNFVARRFKFCCPSLYISVARRFSRRCPWFFQALPVVFYADGRRCFRPF